MLTTCTNVTVQNFIILQRSLSIIDSDQHMLFDPSSLADHDKSKTCFAECLHWEGFLILWLDS